MEHEVILRRDDGVRVKIIARVSIRTYPSEIVYSVHVFTCARNKRTWVDVIDSGSFSWGKMSAEEKRSARQEAILRVVSEDELQAVFCELHNKLKPEPGCFW